MNEASKKINGAEYVLEISQIAALIFIPEDTVEKTSETLIKSEFYEINEFAPLLNYLDRILS